MKMLEGVGVMSRKKESSTSLSPEDSQQIEHLLAQYRQIAATLHNSRTQADAEAALKPFTELSEAAQLAFIKALARETFADAADVLTAINALSPSKEMRKDARRGLIRLEASKTYPKWTPPIAHQPAVQLNIANPPRFWKGLVTQSRDQGEMQLMLAWEQGYDYSDVRLLTFLLDYWRDGVKDASVETISKRRANERINMWRSQATEFIIVDCTIAEGKRLIEEALSVNEWRKTTPSTVYRNNLPAINNLIMQASDPGADHGQTFITPELTDQEVAINFLGAWSLGDFGLAYDFLSQNNSLNEGLAREEWVKRHRDWNDEAHPARLELGFVREPEQRQSGLWVPGSTRLPIRKEAEIGWSVELTDTQLSGTLRDMPMGTAINKETGRHWFWTSYKLTKEGGAWRIQSMADEGASVQALPIGELQKRIKDYEDAIEQAIQRRETNVEAFFEELSWRFTQLLHFYDALIARLPLDRKACDDAYQRAVAMGNPERTMVYLERLAQRFPDQHGDVLRSLAATQIAYAYSDRTQYMPERRDHFLALAETTLQEAMQADSSILNYILQAELFLSMQRNDEAEEALLKARAMTPGRDEEAAIESSLGTIAMRRERFEDAIPHFQHVTEIKPDTPGIWFNLGFAQRLLSRFEEAEASYKRAVQQEPEDIRTYSELTAIYMNRDERQEARRIAEQGVQTNPESAHLRALLASVLFELGDARGAQKQIEEAEAIDPELEIIQRVRQQMNAEKKR
jgi:tetratricopeptide (TPR) repeat protein